MNALVPFDTLELLPPVQELTPVPPNLIPTDSKSINYDWAKNTFRYAYLFIRNFSSKDCGENETIQEWIDKALELQAELRELGVAKVMKNYKYIS